MHSWAFIWSLSILLLPSVGFFFSFRTIKCCHSTGFFRTLFSQFTNFVQEILTITTYILKTSQSSSKVEIHLLNSRPLNILASWISLFGYLPCIINYQSKTELHLFLLNQSLKQCVHYLTSKWYYNLHSFLNQKLEITYICYLSSSPVWLTLKIL